MPDDFPINQQRKLKH